MSWSVTISPLKKLIGKQLHNTCLGLSQTDDGKEQLRHRIPGSMPKHSYHMNKSVQQ